MKTLASFVVAMLLLISPAQVRAAGNAAFSWQQNTVNVNVNDSITVPLILSTDGSTTTGADALLGYDPTKVEVTGITFTTPSLYSYNQSKIQVGDSSILITSSDLDPASSYNGSGTLALITIKGLQLGTTSFTWKCQSGETNDTNIMQQGGTDVVNCGSLRSLSITVQQSGENTQSTTNTSSNSTGSTGSSTSNGSCSNLQSSPSNLVAKAQSNSSILLTWTKEPNATSYALKYGTSPGSYQYGASSIGNVSTFSVNYLKAGVTYYFALAGTNNCSTSQFITASARTNGGTGGSTTTQQPPATNVPSFDTLVSQVQQTQQVPTVSTAPISDERLNVAPAISNENMLPGQAKTVATKPTSTLPPMPVLAAGAVAGIGGIGALLWLLLRKRATTPPPVTTVPEAHLEEVTSTPKMPPAPPTV